MIKIKLSESERREIEGERRQSTSKHAEKALMILMSDEGMSVPEISRKLKRHGHTVRRWLKRYQADGVGGLQRLFSPGRPSPKRNQLKEILPKIIEKSPTEYGYQEYQWNIGLMSHYCKAKQGLDVSDDTIERALKDLKYVYKRPTKAVHSRAPSADAKKEAVAKLVGEIQTLFKQDNPCEVFSMDESHFSTEPYLSRGWIKKRWPPQNFPSGKKTKKRHFVWGIEFKDASFLLEKIL